MGRRPDLDWSHACRDCAVGTSAVCSTLDVTALADLRNQGSSIQLAAGQPLFHQGDPADRTFSLTSGVVKLYSVLPDGRRQVIAFHFPGEFIGFSPSEDYHCTAEAVSAATLCRFETGRFEQFARSSDELARSRHERVARDLVAAQTRAMVLGQAAARELLAHFLCDVHRRSQARPAGASGIVPLPMSRSDIAEYLGLAKETVSRELSALRATGIVRTISRNLLEIRDMERLRRLAIV